MRGAGRGLLGRAASRLVPDADKLASRRAGSCFQIRGRPGLLGLAIGPPTCSRPAAPPATLQRVLGPVLILTSLAVLGSGVMLAVTGPGGSWGRIHQLSFYLWLILAILTTSCGRGGVTGVAAFCDEHLRCVWS